jgi:hypothetical protein
LTKLRRGTGACQSSLVIDGGQQHSHLVKLAPVSDQHTALPMPDIGVRGEILALDNAGSWTNHDRADDIELANLVVPRVG